MKKPSHFFATHFHSLTMIGASVLITQSASGAISISSTGASETFDAAPPVTSWSTRAIGVDQTSYMNVADLDALMTTAGTAPTVASISTALVTYDGTTNPLAGYDADPADENVVMRPTSNGASVLLATLQNDTGGTLSEIGISYDFESSPESAGDEEIPGWRAYLSVAGDGSDWTPISDFDGLGGTKSTTLNFTTPLAASETFYIAWLDDNSPGSASADDTNAIDNFVVTVIPEPSSVLLLAMSGLGLLARRRR